MESIRLSTDHLSFEQDSLSPLTSISSYPQLPRSISPTSIGSFYSTETCSSGRESFGSSTSSAGTSYTQSSSASSRTRQSFGLSERHVRRGYVRPQGTDFAASAKSRESVLSLGSIAHLQYYFARTGLLDGKGGRRARKKEKYDSYDFTSMDTPFNITSSFISDNDSPYASLGIRSELSNMTRGEINSPAMGEHGEEYFCSDGEDEDEDDENHPHMLPPTVSTYNHREKHIPHPPTLEELKEELEKTLADAVKVLSELKYDPNSIPESHSPTSTESEHNSGIILKSEGWHEIQGVYILDIMTLAIRAAKMYYTSHEQPARLASIKPERQIRAELLSVMEVLRKMATRNFASGVKREELESMDKWVESIYEILHKEEVMIEAERQHRASWTWLDDDNWCGKSAEREWAFIKSMDPELHSLPVFKSVDDVEDNELPTEFLKEFMTGLRLVKLHNSIIRKSKRSFGAIDKWHTDFRKPYRCTENLKYWIKAAELRFEVVLDFDVAGVVHGADRVSWKKFEDAILLWCSTVRREMSTEFNP